MSRTTPADVFLIETIHRKKAVESLMDKFGLAAFADEHVAIKANYNSADPFPASTHIETLQAIFEQLKEAKVSGVTLGERSGMGNTRRVLEDMGVLDLSRKVGFGAVVLDELDKAGWVKVEREGTHWLRGFYVAKLFAAADKVVQTCCLKTHRFGGHFTLSLKNSVGLVAKKLPGALYDYMWELHSSPYQRQMIAEINKHYKTDLVIMDGTRAFVDGGPEKGRLVEPNLMLASTDRVAIDAVGVAILRSYGTTSQVKNGRIFELEQIRRAAELGVGVQSADQIKLTPIDPESSAAAARILEILKREG